MLLLAPPLFGENIVPLPKPSQGHYFCGFLPDAECQTEEISPDTQYELFAARNGLQA